MATTQTQVVGNLAGKNEGSNNTSKELKTVKEFMGLEILGILEGTLDPNILSQSGDTVLHELIRCAIYDVSQIAICIQNGTDPKIKNREGLTPYELAEKIVTAWYERNKPPFNFSEKIVRIEKYMRYLESIVGASPKSSIEYLITPFKSRSSATFIPEYYVIDGLRLSLEMPPRVLEVFPAKNPSEKEFYLTAYAIHKKTQAQHAKENELVQEPNSAHGNYQAAKVSTL